MNFIFLLQAAPQQPSKVVEVPLWDIISASNAGIGWVINLVLVIMLGYTVFVFVERFLALRKATKEEAGLLNGVKSNLQNGNIDGAKALCAASESPIAKMLAKGISRIGSAKNESIASTIENTGKFFGYRRAQVYKRFLNDSIWGSLPEATNTEYLHKFSVK
jgi:biopolymer transport protein ExbB